jgi:hypothetical protein
VDPDRFDTLVRRYCRGSSRRRLVAALATVALGSPWAAVLDGSAGKGKKRKKRRKKRQTNQPPQFNEFGCVDVGGRCTNADQCCSGICEGGKSDKRCLAHDTSGCEAGLHSALCVDPSASRGCRTPADLQGECDTTTGNAGYCSAFDVFIENQNCRPCRRDVDCQPFCGAQAACIRCSGCNEPGPLGFTACVGPDACTFPP